MHTPDLPLYPGPSPLLDLGLWNHLALTQVIEFVLLGAGLWGYGCRTTARKKVGRYGLLGLVALLVLVYVGSLLSPPPASVGALGWSGQLFWLTILLAYWVGRHRGPSGETRLASAPSIS